MQAVITDAGWFTGGGATLRVRLRGLDERAVYRVTSATGGTTRRASGRELMDSLEITLGQAPSSDLITYRR